MYCCELCGSTFTLKQNMNKHVKNVHNKYEKMVFKDCKLCNYKGNEVNLAYHVLNKHRKTNLNCDMCTKVFSNKTNLNRHRRNEHDMSETFECPTCYKSFSRHDDMKAHMKIHKTTEEIKLPQSTVCDFCQKEFADKKTFRNTKRMFT